MLAKTFGQPLHVVCAYHVSSAADGLALSAGVSPAVADLGWVEDVLRSAAAQIRESGVEVFTRRSGRERRRGDLGRRGQGRRGSDRRGRPRNRRQVSIHPRQRAERVVHSRDVLDVRRQHQSSDDHARSIEANIAAAASTPFSSPVATRSRSSPRVTARPSRTIAGSTRPSLRSSTASSQPSTAAGRMPRERLLALGRPRVALEEQPLERPQLRVGAGRPTSLAKALRRARPGDRRAGGLTALDLLDDREQQLVARAEVVEQHAMTRADDLRDLAQRSSADATVGVRVDERVQQVGSSLVVRWSRHSAQRSARSVRRGCACAGLVPRGRGSAASAAA